MYRMGLLATLRSRVKGGQTIGVMITASHNPEPDNGCKLVDPMGEMLEQSWEKLATDLVNVSDHDLQDEIAKIIASQNIDIGSASSVFVGMDNRYHSPGLLKAVSDGVLTLKGKVKSFGICTTPMLHYYVVCANTNNAYGIATEDGYYKKLSASFKSLRGSELERGKYVNRLVFDGANGVGARKMLQFLKHMDNCLGVEVFNKGEGKINHECGADYVKVQQRCPIGLPELEPYARCCSVDGDADRIVYFFNDENNQFNLLDGDRIATLIAGYLKDLLAKCNVDLTLGLVQTAYANGASTDYIQNKLVRAIEIGGEFLASTENLKSFFFCRYRKYLFRAHRPASSICITKHWRMILACISRLTATERLCLATGHVNPFTLPRRT